MNEQVKRYWPAQVLTDRWEMGSMDEAADGDYVHWDDYDALRAENERLRCALKDSDAAMMAYSADLVALRPHVVELLEFIFQRFGSPLTAPELTDKTVAAVRALEPFAASPAPEVQPPEQPLPRRPEQPGPRPYDYGQAERPLECHECADRLANEAGSMAVVAELGAALKRLTFAARTSGGTAGPDAELMAACGQAERALSLGAIGRAFMDAAEQAARQEPVAHRLINDLGEVMTDWHDGPPPANFTDLCGQSMKDVRIELAFSAPQPTQDVSGLVEALEALEAVIAYDESAEDEDGALMMHYADMLKKVRNALTAHSQSCNPAF